MNPNLIAIPLYVASIALMLFGVVIQVLARFINKSEPDADQWQRHYDQAYMSGMITAGALAVFTGIAAFLITGVYRLLAGA